ncbi:MAG: DUF4190 domain-containing protein [Lachnospiraceae bacterium]|nr:DUF4190 domain-containing protein [Lachnospiraceae bacterium]
MSDEFNYNNENDSSVDNGNDTRRYDSGDANQNYYESAGNSTYYTSESYEQTEIKEPSKGFGIASLVLGILSIVTFCTMLNYILAILAIIFGAIHIAKNKGRGGKGMGIAGLVMGIISIVISIIFWTVFVLAIGSMATRTDQNGIYDYYDTFEDYFGEDYFDENGNMFFGEDDTF